MKVEVVGGNLEKALRSFKRIVDRDGIHRSVKMRNQSPNKTDRKKAKAILANRKRLEREKKNARLRLFG